MACYWWQWMHWWSWMDGRFLLVNIDGIGWMGERIDGFIHVWVCLTHQIGFIPNEQKMVAQMPWIIKRPDLETLGSIDSKWLPIHHLLYKNDMKDEDNDFSKTVWNTFISSAYQKIVVNFCSTWNLLTQVFWNYGN